MGRYCARLVGHREGSRLTRDRIDYFHFALKPGQDSVTRAKVKLLGPCFKTGQAEPDLLAADDRTKHRNSNAAATDEALDTVSAFLRQTPNRTETAQHSGLLALPPRSSTQAKPGFVSLVGAPGE